MLLYEREFEVDRYNTHLLEYFERAVKKTLCWRETPIRFAVIQSDKDTFHCELGVLCPAPLSTIGGPKSIFAFRRRQYVTCSTFTTVMIVPTGIGAEIGGHAGDACPAAKLLASVCDTLIIHPNVANASDINEMPQNSLYVEGSTIADLMMGTCGLIPVRSNRILMLVNSHKDRMIFEATVNAVSAARASLGLNCRAVIELVPPLVMRGFHSKRGTAAGRVGRFNTICRILDPMKGSFDAVGVTSVIDVPESYHTEYFAKAGEMVNPWGAVEAMLTHAIAKLYGVPAAHSPMFESIDIANLDVGIVDPRMAAEAVSETFLHCILKGLHKSPQITRVQELFHAPGVLTAENVSCLVIPDGCIGLPTLAAIEQGIPVIAVRENRNRMQNVLNEFPFAPGGLITVANYLEAAGVIAAMQAGVTLESVRRPLEQTTIIKDKK